MMNVLMSARSRRTNTQTLVLTDAERRVVEARRRVLSAAQFRELERREPAAQFLRNSKRQSPAPSSRALPSIAGSPYSPASATPDALAALLAMAAPLHT